MLTSALELPTPAALRFPKTPPQPFDGLVGEGLEARRVRQGDGALCILGVGKMADAAFQALALLGADADRITLYDVRVLPPDPTMIDDAVRHERVITIEDGTRHGGAGTLMVAAVRDRAQILGLPFPTTRILGVPRAYLTHDSADALLAAIGLDPAGIADALGRLLRDEPEFSRPTPESPTPHYS